MPWVIGVLLSGFAFVLVSAIGRWILGIGLSIVAYEGISDLMATALASVMANATGVSAAVLGLMSLCKLFSALNLIFSAIVGKFTFGAAGAAGNVIKRLVVQ